MNPFADRLTAGDVSSYLKGRDRQKKERRPQADSYREAAAVLAAITDVKALRASTGESGEAAELLEPDLVPTAAARQLGGGYILKHDVRTRALKRLGTPEAILRVIDVNRAEAVGPVQLRFEEYLRGTPKPLAEQSSEELEQSLQAVLWLDELDLPAVPRPDAVRGALSRARLIRPFDKLAGAHFRGRVTELDRLRRFVGIITPESRRHRLEAAVTSLASSLLDIKRKRALNIFGAGGIGKSALVAKFFLEHTNLPADQRVPFAYLDFDNPLLNINDLSTIAGAIMRQLALQVPSVKPFEFAGATNMVDIIAEVLGMLSQGAQQPFLLVLDTFEEVQYGGEHQAYPLWEMLDNLQERWPFMRVLVSGRAPVTSLKLGGEGPEAMELTGVDTAAAEAILRAVGVTDAELASALVKQVGAVPLSLHLAAAVVKKEGATTGGVKDLQTSSYVFFSVSDAVIQGQLYERILGHLHTDDVKKLAHPGLVLRRISADLILKVLKEPCDLQVSNLDDAKRLFDDLARETALVAEESSGWLSHRTDLRRTMLKLLVSRNPAIADDIHHAAARYYEGREEIGATAEELYHRLMLGQKPLQRAAEFLRRDIRESLSRSIVEFPVTAQIFLSGFGYEIAPTVLNEATREQHQQYIAARIVELLPHGLRATAQADALLKDVRYQGSNSPLYLEEARTRFIQGRYDEVFGLTDEGLRCALAAQDHVRVLDLIALKCWTLEVAKQSGELEQALGILHSCAERLNRKAYLAQWAAQSLRRKRLADPVSQNEVGIRDLDPTPELSFLDAFLGSCRPDEFLSIAPVLAGIFGPLAAVSPDRVIVVATELMPPGSVIDPTRLSNKDGSGRSASDVGHSIDRALEQWPIMLPYVAAERAKS